LIFFGIISSCLIFFLFAILLTKSNRLLRLSISLSAISFALIYFFLNAEIISYLFLLACGMLTLYFIVSKNQNELELKLEKPVKAFPSVVLVSLISAIIGSTLLGSGKLTVLSPFGTNFEMIFISLPVLFLISLIIFHCHANQFQSYEPFC